MKLNKLANKNLTYIKSDFKYTQFFVFLMNFRQNYLIVAKISSASLSLKMLCNEGNQDLGDNSKK